MKNLNDFIKQNNGNFNSEMIISDLLEAEIKPENCYIIGILDNPRRLFLLEDLEGMNLIFICITLCKKDFSLRISKFPRDFMLSTFANIIDGAKKKLEENNENT